MVVDFLEEGPRLEIVTDLRKLIAVRDEIRIETFREQRMDSRDSIRSVSSSRQLLVSLLDDLDDYGEESANGRRSRDERRTSVSVLSSGDTIGDSDDENRLRQSTASSGVQNERLNNLVSESGSKGLQRMDTSVAGHDGSRYALGAVRKGIKEGD